jgi:hypothetical protein
MSKDEEENKDLTVPDNLSKDKLKVIQETYNIYSDESVEIKRKANLANTGLPAKQGEAKKTEPRPEADLLASDSESPKKEMKKSKFTTEKSENNAIIKKIIFEIDSIENLNPDLQRNIKRLMNSVTKQEVSKLIEEIEREKDKFLTDNSSILGKMSNSEKNALERKLAENEVSREVTEINLSAIISGLNKLVID